MHLREHDEQLLQAQHLLLQVKMVLFHCVISCYLPFLFSCSWTLYHLSSKLGFDGIADFINDEGDGVWSNSEVVGQAWIIVTAG
jgi:hypothetical protein